jgi:hypothetical protein
MMRHNLQKCQIPLQKHDDRVLGTAMPHGRRQQPADIWLNLIATSIPVLTFLSTIPSCLGIYDTRFLRALKFYHRLSLTSPSVDDAGAFISTSSFPFPFPFITGKSGVVEPRGIGSRLFNVSISSPLEAGAKTKPFFSSSAP